MSDHSTAVEQTPRSIAILGADALLVALPSTPTQLANACFAGGFDDVFPATWGDELIATGCLEQLESRTGPAIFCACPLVAEQLRGAEDLRQFIVPLISPPVAVARYLRSHYSGDALHITYVGDCPGADDQSIDVRLSPQELLSTLSRRGILPATQRPDLGTHAAHDRRRFYSLPGGVPAPQWLAAQRPKRVLVDVHAGDALAGLANQTLARGTTLIDFAPQLGCACAGAIGGTDAENARGGVLALEPPQAQSAIIEATAHVDVSLAPVGDHHDADVAWGDFLAALPAALSMHPEHSSGSIARQSSRTMPRRTLQKKAALPRAYLAARAGAHREKGAMPRAESAQPVAARQHARREPVAVASSSDVAVASSDVYGTRREEISATRPNPWLVRRASHEGMTGPRGGLPQRGGLATTDRWLLSGLVLTSSVIVAVLTSTLTVRGMQRTAGTAPRESVLRAPTLSVAAAPDPRIRDSTTMSSTMDVRSTHTNDSALVAAAAHIDSAPNREEASRTVAPPSPSARVASMPLHDAHALKPAAPRAQRHPVSLAEHTRSTPAISPTIAPRTAPSAAVISAAPIETRTSESAPPATRAPSITAPSITAPSIAAPAPAASPLANPQVLEELRAIHAEINARKRHMDSLSAALDSLNRVPKPD
jgi:hypothetical protein